MRCDLNGYTAFVSYKPCRRQYMNICAPGMTYNVPLFSLSRYICNYKSNGLCKAG